MRLLLNNWIFLGVAIFLVHSTQCGTAQAGFISTADEFVQGQWSSGVQSEAPADDERDEGDGPPKSLQELVDEALSGRIPAGETTGTGSSRTNASSSAAVIAVFAVDAASRRQLTAYLSGEQFLLLPTPFLDGVFHPPRATRPHI